VLRLPDTADIQCEIRNFCQAGLLLKLPDPAIQRTLPRGLGGVEVVFTAGQSATTFRLEGRLSHVSSNGVGFVFDLAPPFQVLLALQEKSMPSPWAQRSVPAKLADTHEHCVQALENALYPLVESLPAQIQADLAEQLDNAANDDPDPPPAATFALEEQQARPLVERFYAHVMEQAKSFVVPDLSLHPEAGAIYSESQSQRLIFEDWMNLIDKVIRLESKYEGVLRLLESRFSVLAQRDIVNHDNPFGPSVLCHSFHYSLREAGLDNDQRNRVYEIFASLLDERLAKLYADLRILSKPLDALKKASAEKEDAPGPLFLANNDTPPPVRSAEATLPRPQPEPSLPAKTAIKPRSVRPAAPAAAPSPAPLESRPPQPDAFTAFVVLFRYVESQANKGAGEALDDAGRAAIIAALRKLQANIPSVAAPYLNAPGLQAGLNQILAETGQEKLLASAEARENLQLLGLLLDTLLGDMVVPVGATPYFKKLQLPLLIASFADPGLLHGKEHPAREILNQLDYLTQAANAQGEIDNAELLHSLDMLFARIADTVADNPEVFADALESLKKLTIPLGKAYASRLERVAEACEGGQRMEHARRRVDEEIGTRLGGKTVPAAIPALLDAGWRQLLVLTHLRQGTDNDAWRRQLAVIDLLLMWLSQPPPASPPSQFNVQWLLNFVGEQLAGLSVDPADVGRIQEKIADLLPNGDRQPSAPEYVEIPPADTAPQEGGYTLHNRLLGFRVGEWLKFASAKGPWIPLRLTWIGKDPARYVFVNRKGIKSLDVDAAKFVQFLDEKRASRMENLEELSLVDRTAKFLLSALRDRLR